MSTNHHRFPYYPTDHVHNDRRYVLRIQAERLLYRYVARPANGRGAGVLTFTDFGDMLYEISGSDMYGTTTDEKACSWEYLVRRLNRDKNILRVTTDGLRAENIDGFYLGLAPTGDIWGHIVVAFSDNRHGTAAGPDSYTDESFEDAVKEIDAYERQVKGIPIPWRNNGDFNASVNTVRTMFAFRSGGFAGFARMWNWVFLGR